MISDRGRNSHNDKREFSEIFGIGGEFQKFSLFKFFFFYFFRRVYTLLIGFYLAGINVKAEVGIFFPNSMAKGKPI